MFGKKSDRYIEYKNAESFFNNISEQVDVIALGSTMARYDYDFYYWNKSGLNLASSPQTLTYDFRLLKRYGFTIKQGTIVLINIAEFTFLVNKYDKDTNNHKYYFYLNKEDIENYKAYKKILLKYFPCLVDFALLRSELSQMARKFIKKGNKCFLERCKDIEIGWEREFDIQNNVLIHNYKNEEKYNNYVVDNMITYIKEKKAIPVVVVPPVAPSLYELIPKEILANCLYSHLYRLAEKIKVIDFSSREDIFPDDVFESPLVLNMQGRKIFNDEIKKMVDKWYGIQ